MAKHSTMKVGLLTKKQMFIWDVLEDYERVAWVKCMKLCKHVQIEEMKHFKKLGHAQGDM